MQGWSRLQEKKQTFFFYHERLNLEHCKKEGSHLEKNIYVETI